MMRTRIALDPLRLLSFQQVRDADHEEEGRDGVMDAEIVIGAVIAGLVGLITERFREWRTTSKTRATLAGILTGSLDTEAPSGNDLYGPIIGSDPPTARYVQVAGLDEILAPGVLDPRNEEDLILGCLHLRSAIGSYNRSAELYNNGWLQGVDQRRLDAAWRGMHADYSDVAKGADELNNMIERVGPRLAMPGEEPLSFTYRQKNKIRLWKRRRRLRRAEITEDY